VILCEMKRRKLQSVPFRNFQPLNSALRPERVLAMSRRLLLVIAVGAVALLAFGSLATASSSKTRVGKDTYSDFRLPSNNIFCAYVVSSSPYAKYIRCDIMSGIKPKPTGKCKIRGKSRHQRRPQRDRPGDFSLLERHCLQQAREQAGLWKDLEPRWFYLQIKAIRTHVHKLSSHGFFLSRQHSYRF